MNSAFIDVVKIKIKDNCHANKIALRP